MTKEYRSRGQVVQQLLAAIQKEGPIGVTRLITIANLTHTRIQEHLSVFEAHGIIERQGDGERPQWILTIRGNEALEELRRIDRAMRDFGIDL
ncbi:MAG TPA: winged helix-turn-helix domain-containing protein [Candidatus Thermoplasmatota archaeon]|nr:winged helix-turn-helix domain-containing protein [Candidatus Thermoplasmatota archaeon]